MKNNTISLTIVVSGGKVAAIGVTSPARVGVIKVRASSIQGAERV